ncbi:uncharacterized protein BDZ99DRAFT_457513 [Mytilinidion resinicola]|uniref:Uncharacterized protein n=1 Tax=Mytilinidion resinicola TaxID=574789 RepID=A0A6A6ZC81_9PEZI|nr:uncharacterized protein BDZ99DRAFT_457513 [Mytilinidion resinicola]KAF2817837.1 hypothetical protein BDZ99DRAFT_457513 [Mytilinidion resinicola]
MGKRSREDTDGDNSSDESRLSKKVKGEKALDREALLGQKHLQETDAYRRESYRLGAFPFLALPAELRNIFYEVVLVRKEVLITSTRPKISQVRGTWGPTSERTYTLDVSEDADESPGNVNLFHVNCQIRNEARPIFYKQNTFRFKMNSKLASSQDAMCAPIAFFRDRP